jgi:ribosomal protein L40E
MDIPCGWATEELAMARTMYRGKQQILFNYLPNRTFDFERVAAIARVIGVRGEPRIDLNSSVVLRRIADEARAWQEEFRPALRDDVFRQPDRFVLLNPRSIESELFPKVLWCQHSMCGRVYDFSRRNHMPNQCPSCHQGRLVQLRFVKIHRCGALQPLLPPSCRQCHTSNHMALDTRGSERISNFRWICRQCNTTLSLYGGNCSECQWPDRSLRGMDIEVHRAGRTYYAHTTVLLNIPHRSLDSFFSLPEWPAIAAAKYLGMSEVTGKALTDYGASSQQRSTQNTGLSGSDLDELMRRQASGELTAEEFVHEMQTLREQRQQEHQASLPSGIVRILTQSTGVPLPIWQHAGQEMFEVIMPMETGNPTELDIYDPTEPSSLITQRLGISRLALVSDYPIITATYGFSRGEYRPNQCRLNPFPPHQDYGGRYPIFVDQVEADALLISLNPDRVIAWLEKNGCQPMIPSGTDPSLARKAYFIQLLSGMPLRETLHVERREGRMVFGLLHTLSHLSVRRAALLCGLDPTSLSEYLLPAALTFALYCNHRFGATIGALTALFEQSLTEWLNAVSEARRCVYDPMCRDRSSNCHACTHLAETSCRFFNLNLSRAFLFGGHDSELGNISVGYFDTSLL